MGFAITAAIIMASFLMGYKQKLNAISLGVVSVIVQIAFHMLFHPPPFNSAVLTGYLLGYITIFGANYCAWLIGNKIAPTSNKNNADSNFKWWKYITILLVMCFSATFYFYWDSLDITPKENADGTIDYTLVAKLSKRDWKWVLQFPNHVWIDVPEARETSNTISTNGLSLPRTALANRNLYFYLDTNDLSFIKKGTDHNRSEVLIVSIDNWPEVYRDVYKGQDTGFVRKYGYKKSPRCREVSEVAPGFYKFRNATREEKFEHIKNSNMPKKNQKQFLKEKCTRGYEATYAIYSEENDPVVGGGCRTAGKNSCLMNMWLPHGRIIKLRFPEKDILKLNEFYSKVLEIMNTAILVDQSDLNWGEPY